MPNYFFYLLFLFICVSVSVIKHYLSMHVTYMTKQLFLYQAIHIDIFKVLMMDRNDPRKEKNNDPNAIEH